MRPAPDSLPVRPLPLLSVCWMEKIWYLLAMDGSVSYCFFHSWMVGVQYLLQLEAE